MNLIRAIVGMCAKHFRWRKHSLFFKRKYSENLLFSFFPNPALGNDIVVVGAEVTRIARHSKSYCFILDKEMKAGIFKVVFGYESPACGNYACGLVHKSSSSNWLLSYYPISGVCLVYSNGIGAGDDLVYYGKLFKDDGKHIITLELAYGLGAEGTYLSGSGNGHGEKLRNVGQLHIFVDGEQIPHIITKIPLSVHFFFLMQAVKWVKVLSFQQLAVPTASGFMRCAEYEWR